MAASQTWGSAWAPRDARKAAELWREYVQTVRAAAKNLSDENFLEIRYEELLNAPQENLQRVPNFLCLHWVKKKYGKQSKEIAPPVALLLRFRSTAKLQTVKGHLSKSPKASYAKVFREPGNPNYLYSIGSEFGVFATR